MTAATNHTDARPGTEKRPRPRRDLFGRKKRLDDLADSGVSLTADAWRRLRRNPVFPLGAGIVTLFVLVAIFADALAPQNPSVTMLADQVVRARNEISPAQPGHPLGGDQFGYDLASRLLVGSRQTLLVGVLATLIGLTGGVTLGTLAGAIGGAVDTVVMRLVDVLLSIPSLLLAVSITALFAKGSLYTVIVAVAVVQIPVIVQSTLVLATSIIDAAALSFLGVGNPDRSRPEWGQMLGEAQNFIDSHPSLAFYRAICIIVVALGFTLVGESLREALDPRNRR